MLAVTSDTVRLFLHVLAATVWVGGQLVLAALVPLLRSLSATAPRTAARQFARVAWPAYVVLLGTGAWNVVAERHHVHGAYRTTLAVKIAAVLVSGATAWLHGRARTTTALAAWGALSGLSALSALFLGILLAG
jgi:putative copper export protein